MNIRLEKELTNGYYLIKKESFNELTLVKMDVDEDGNVYEYNEILSSKFEYKLLEKYKKMLSANTKVNR